MKFKKLLAVCTTALLALGLAGLGTAAAVADGGVSTIEWSQPHNLASYWVDYGPHDGASCYKLDADSNGVSSSAHGTSTGSTVTLNTFNQAWPGDHWELLVIKAGTQETVVIHPDAGVAYTAPDGKKVSHWIVCKGTTPTSTPEDASASATPTAATCDAPGIVNFSITNATWENDTDLTDGSRLAIANAGHLFPGGASTLVVNYTFPSQLTGEQCQDPEDASASATPTAATCDAPGIVNFSITNATWENDTDLTDGSRLAIANAGHLFPGGASTLVVNYTFPSQLTGEQCEVDYVTVGDPYAVDLECTETGFTDGYIWVDFGGNLANELDYRIQGGPNNVDFLATQEVNVLDPGDYTVTAIAKTGHTLDPNAQSVWLLTIGESGDCQLISHPPVTPTASMSNLTCSSNGSYTLVDSEGIKWLVNGVATPAGTYKVTSASTVNVEAQLTSTIDYTWEDGAQTTWTFQFTNPKDCLPTLAFTGASGGDLGLLLAGGLLFLGGAVIAVDRRLRLGSN